jgi:hypothetical protein
MKSPISDELIEFLLSCVKYSDHGKIDFVGVSKECGIVSKGAASVKPVLVDVVNFLIVCSNCWRLRFRAKRYERLLKSKCNHQEDANRRGNSDLTAGQERDNDMSPPPTKRVKTEKHLSADGQENGPMEHGK